MTTETTIRAANWDGTPIILTEANGKLARLGSVYTTFRGEAFTLTGALPPTHEASSGRVTGRIHGEGRMFFPTVVGLTWRPVAELVKEA